MTLTNSDSQGPSREHDRTIKQPLQPDIIATLIPLRGVENSLRWSEILTPPIRSKFLFINETWVTIGWAKRASDSWTYVWCGLDDATHVIGKHADSLTNWVAPIADVVAASRTRGWEYDRPDFLVDKGQQEADEKIGRHFRVLDGEISFMSADDTL
jgi:hypothetical protein